MKLNDLTIGEAKEIAQLFAMKETTESKTLDLGLHIVVLQRGWVLIGQLHMKGSDCSLTRCAVIRTWGTTKGLGEIAQNGPTEKTILDKCPTCFFHELTVCFIMSCEASKWENRL